MNQGFLITTFGLAGLGPSVFLVVRLMGFPLRSMEGLAGAPFLESHAGAF